MKAKMTPWFDGKTKPVRPGVYQQRSGSGASIGYQCWDGALWYAWASTADAAVSFEALEFPADRAFQNDDWRGLAKDPTT